MAPENGWLEDDRFLLGFGLFSGAFAVSFREGNPGGDCYVSQMVGLIVEKKTWYNPLKNHLR